MAIEPGIKNEIVRIVQYEDSARASGGESLPEVLSTPKVVMYLERTCHLSVLPYLPKGQSTVGAVVNIRHLAATPVGMEVRFCSELLEVDRRRLTFHVEAWDQLEKIAEGTHDRFIINQSGFDQRLAEKREKMQKSGT